MKFILQFDMENDAFEFFPHEEAVTVLTAALASLQGEGFDDNGKPRSLRDSNGNTIGAWGITSNPGEVARVLGPDILRSVEQHRSDEAKARATVAQDAFKTRLPKGDKGAKL